MAYAIYIGVLITMAVSLAGAAIGGYRKRNTLMLSIGLAFVIFAAPFLALAVYLIGCHEPCLP